MKPIRRNPPALERPRSAAINAAVKNGKSVQRCGRALNVVLALLAGSPLAITAWASGSDVPVAGGSTPAASDKLPAAGTLTATNEPDALVVRYALDILPKINADERAAVLLLLSRTNGPVLNPQTAVALEQRKPGSAKASPYGYLTVLVPIAESGESGATAYRFLLLPFGDADLAPLLKRGITLRLPYRGSGSLFSPDYD